MSGYIYFDLPGIEVCSHGNELLNHRIINQNERNKDARASQSESMTFDPLCLNLQYHFTQKVIQVL